MFSAIAAQKNYIIVGADVTNAYAQSPPPKIPTFVRVDKQYIDWYLESFGVLLDKNMVLPVLKALQGHHESGALWLNQLKRFLWLYLNICLYHWMRLKKLAMLALALLLNQLIWKVNFQLKL